MCLSSSFSSAGYRSSLVKGLLRLVVKVRIPGLTAPLDSMYSPSSSLWHTWSILACFGRIALGIFSTHFHIFLFRSKCLVFFHLPVLCEYTDCRWMVGTVGHIHGFHLGHQAQKKPSDLLLVLWKSAHTNGCLVKNKKAIKTKNPFLYLMTTRTMLFDGGQTKKKHPSSRQRGLLLLAM